MQKKQRLSDWVPFQYIRQKSTAISALLLIAFLHLTVSCSYYRSRTIATPSGSFPKEYNSVEKEPRYVILHAGNEVWHLSDIVANEDTKELKASLSAIDSSHTLFPLPEGRTSILYDKSKAKKTHEIHIYANSIVDKNASEISIPFDNIEKMDVYDRDTGKLILSILGMTFAVMAVIAILIAALKSSCPFVYAKNGESFVFAGEMYPGAILPKLQRTDYLPLPGLKPLSDEYEIQIANELLEIQYTDLAQLVVVNHPQSVEVILDQAGIPHTISEKQGPRQVSADGKVFDKSRLEKKDNVSHLFDGDDKGNQKWNNMILTFDNSARSDHAKLILTARNSLWLDLIYGKFNELAGYHFNRFQASQRKVPAEESIAWRNNQGIPLSVYVKSGGEWTLVERINTVGPMGFRDLVIPVDLGKVPSDITEIKLECGFMFWEVDYAAIDFSNDVPVTMQAVNPFSAVDENGTDVTALIDKADRRYFIQPAIGNLATIKYRAKQAEKGEKQTVYLKNSGYYEYIRNYTGKPQLSKLKTFKEKHRLSDFSRTEYSKFTAVSNLTEVVFNND